MLYENAYILFINNFPTTNKSFIQASGIGNWLFENVNFFTFSLIPWFYNEVCTCVHNMKIKINFKDGGIPQDYSRKP